MPNIPAQEFPELLVFSEGVLSCTHGTGTIFARNFAAYPQERIQNWFIGLADEPLLPRTHSLNSARWPDSNLSPPTTALAKLWNRYVAPRGARRWSVPMNRLAIRKAMSTPAPLAKVVYAIIYSKEGLDALHAFLLGAPKPLPVILQIQDFYPSAYLGLRRALRRLRPWIKQVWAVAPSIAREVGPILGIPVHVDPLFNLKVPDTRKVHHRDFCAEFRTVVLGNFWQPQLLEDLKSAWRETRRQLPALGPIHWHCHPRGVARLQASGYQPGPELLVAPFVVGDDLFSTLAAADLAIIPFGRSDQPESDYERYSLPSRVTELAAAGLPIVGLTGANTPLHDYLTRHSVGDCVPASSTEAVATLLTQLIRDTEKRNRMGQAARALAVQVFPIERQQAWMYQQIVDVANG